MPRYSPLKLTYDLRERMFEEFVRTIASMESVTDFRNLFEDLFTRTEITMFARRLHAGHLLLAGESYKDIENRLHMSSGTVRNIAGRIAKGGQGMGKASALLEKIIPEIMEEVSANMRAVENKGFERLKLRYSSYYLIENIAKNSPRWIRENTAKRKRKKDF